MDRTQIIYNKPQLLPDGVFIAKDGETQKHVATWDIIITIDSPKEEIGLRDNIRHFRRTMYSLHHQRKSLNITRQLWERRIQGIEHTMLGYVNGSAPRTRRGLLDIVGYISQKLFGTATEAQINECRKLIAQLAIKDKRITHSLGNLFTLVNQSHDRIKENRNHINDIQTLLNNITLEINYMATVTQNQQEYIEFVESE